MTIDGAMLLETFWNSQLSIIIVGDCGETRGFAKELALFWERFPRVSHWPAWPQLSIWPTAVGVSQSSGFRLLPRNHLQKLRTVRYLDNSIDFIICLYTVFCSVISCRQLPSDYGDRRFSYDLCGKSPDLRIRPNSHGLDTHYNIAIPPFQR